MEITGERVLCKPVQSITLILIFASMNVDLAGQNSWIRLQDPTGQALGHLVPVDFSLTVFINQPICTRLLK